MNIKKSKVSILNTKYIEEKIAYFQNIINTTYKEYMFPSNGRKYNKWNLFLI